jgi:subtilisin family serine protease
MRESGPEPIIVQLKESLRQSDDLDSELAKLASVERESSVAVEKRWAGVKYLELVSFPKNFTEAQALAVVAKLQQLPSVEKVVAFSAFNLEFRSGDFSREFKGNQAIPDVARRGFDADRLSRGSHVAPDIATALKAEHVPNRIIVRWKDEYVWKADKTGFSQQVADFHAQAGARVTDERKSGAPNLLIQTLEFDSSKASVASMLARYQASPLVDYAQPDYVYSMSLTPNDPFFAGYQYNLVQIKADIAWNTTTGTQSLVVAVGDTGANVAHPEFAPNLASGSYNFVSNNTNVADDNGHGSNVAAIIGAKGNNNYGMTGVDWNVSLLHLKVLNAQGSGASSTVAAGIDYAYQHGAIAINLSLGNGASGSLDLTLRDAVRRARTNNMVVVCAAGNGDANGNGLNSDLSNNLISPASIPTDNNIAVGAVDSSDAKTGFSNYGAYRVELAAPGVAILGLAQTVGVYSQFTGTSQATPHVTGALELVKSAYPWEGYSGIRDRVLMGVDSVPSLNGFFRTGGRLNIATSLMKRNMMRNLSTRARVENGDRRMIGGFYIAGTGTLKVAIRGLGPSLPPLGVVRLNNPMITLNNGAGQQVFFNDDWNNLPQDQKNDLASVGLTPTDGREAAMVQTLSAGAYTVFVDSQDGQFGVGSFEIYEMEGNTNEQTRLVNVSTRCIVGTGDEVAIAGTILGDPSQAGQAVPKRRLLSFGKGPSLALSGLSGTLPNPYIELHDGSGATIASNDQWQDIDGSSTGLEDKLNESGFAPANGNESAVWPTLQPGFYTSILRDANGASGLGLVEFYEY